jgi:hypothetical protein
MKIKELNEGMIFNITSEDNPEIVTRGKITDIWSMRAGAAWGIQFDDELETFTWGKDEDELPQAFEFVGEININEYRR